MVFNQKQQERFLVGEDHELEMHDEEICHCFPPVGIAAQLRHITFSRALLVAMFGGFLFLLTTGWLGPADWDWKKITFTVGAVFALYVVLTVPDKPFPATVRYIASRAEFTHKEVQTPDERVKLVYAVKLYLTKNPDHRLTPGLPADTVIRWKEGVEWEKPHW